MQRRQAGGRGKGKPPFCPKLRARRFFGAKPLIAAAPSAKRRFRPPLRHALRRLRQAEPFPATRPALFAGVFGRSRQNSCRNGIRNGCGRSVRTRRHFRGMTRKPHFRAAGLPGRLTIRDGSRAAPQPPIAATPPFRESGALRAFGTFGRYRASGASGASGVRDVSGASACRYPGTRSHSPRVKSGKATGALPCASEAAVSSPMHDHSAAS